MLNILKMNQNSLISISSLSIFFVLTLQIWSSNAAETSKYGYWLRPNLTGPQDCVTSGVADAGFYLVDPQFQYAFILVDGYSPLLAVVRSTYVGQANLATNLDIYSFIGFTILVNLKVYFFNLAGCPNVVPVKNDNNQVYGYRRFYGKYCYRAFDALTADCDYQCSTCPIAALGRDPQQISFEQGASTFVLRNIQSLTLVPYGLQDPQSLKSTVSGVLDKANIEDYEVTVARSCVNVIRKYPFLYSCPVNKTALSNSFTQGGVLAPNLAGPLGCTTTGSADAAFYLINETIPYTFVIRETLNPLVAIARTVYIGQAGLEINLNIYNFIGFVVQVNGTVYYINIAGCPIIEPVENSEKLIYGFRNLFGYLAYQAFEALTSNCNFQCNTCPVSLTSEDPNLQEAAQGKSTISVRNLQSYSVVLFGPQFPRFAKWGIDATLKYNGVQDYALTIGGPNCINVNSQSPFLYSCPIANKTLPYNSYISDAISNKGFRQRNAFCSYAISESAQYSKTPQPFFTIYRLLLPANNNAMIFISCYSVFELFSNIAEAVLHFC